MKKITVAEYHKETGLSKKTIYKKIDQGKLKTETQYINNRPITFIVLEGQGFTPDLPPSPEGNLPPSPEGNEKVNGNRENFNGILGGQSFTPDLPPSPEGNLPPSLNSVVELLEKQLSEKDRQIAEKDKQINTLLEQIKQAQSLIDQEQRLHAGTRALLKEAEEPENQEPKKQRSKLYKFFFEV